MSWLFNSSIGRKFIMALSGCCLVLFLLFHAAMNIVSIINIEAYEAICGFLGTNWYAVAGTAGLAFLILLHVVYALVLTWQNRKARGGSAYASSNATPTEWSAKNMFVLGVVLVAFMLLHLYHFWFKMMFAELFHLDFAVLPEEVGGHMTELFGDPVTVVLYLIGLVALWIHLTHGVWSMFQSTGLNGRTWMPRLKCVGNIVATIICIAFALVPIVFYAKQFCC
jgi:succinate dehydrogenase / fumarate reductase cytochrome b subunit